MPIIHTYSDREQKKLNIKIVSSLVIIVGIIILTFTISTIFKPTNIPTEVPTTNVDKHICISKNISENTVEKIGEYIREDKVDRKVSREGKDCSSEIVRNPIDTNPYSFTNYTVYVVIGNLKSEISEIDIDELVKSLNAQKYGKYSIYWNIQTDEFLRSKFDFGVGQTVYSDSEIEKRVASEVNSIGIIPFENVSKFGKIVDIKGNNILRDEIVISSYPLTDTYWVKHENDDEEYIKYITENILPKKKYEKGKFSRVVVTGTSMVGSDAYHVAITSQKKSPDYMIRNIANNFNREDLLIISNESSIYDNCLQNIGSVYLCSFSANLSPITKLGVDAVDTSGNHIMDFGYPTYIKTLDWYVKNKITYFGGGRNEKESQSPKYIKHKDMTIALLGYNFVPPYTYYAKGNSGGSSNVSYEIMERGIKQAKNNSDFIIVNMNFADESQNRVAQFQKDFAYKAIEYGADIVNGVHSYKILDIEVKKDATIFYGLGGFLSPQAKEGLITTHHFYDKKYIGYTLNHITYTKEYELELASGLIQDRMIKDTHLKTRINYE